MLVASVGMAAQATNEQPPDKTAARKSEPQKDEALKEKESQGMRYRLIGPYRGGRSLTGAGIPGNPNVYYFGATGGGVWKSTDGALTWEPIFDKQATSSIGAIAVSGSDPNVLYVGTGETCPRSNISHGDGVYKSTDAGKTWKNVGLRDSRAVGRIVIHPRNPDVAYVAALGHHFGPNEERGVFRTRDGGRTWEKVLYQNQDTGAVDLAMDPRNPNILFATLWQMRRQPWGLVTAGGPGSGLYRSTDGGTTWEQLGEKHGLPKGVWGKVGVDVSASSDRIYALVEAEDGGLYRSDDGGDSWKWVSRDRRLYQRAWYYVHVTADPQDKETVWVLNVQLLKSVDGGRTFNIQRGLPHGDHHGMWIDPRNNRRILSLNDGGATVSTDGGKTWSRQDNQPTAQFYHVITDDQFPYYVYGAQQDNSSVGMASRGPNGAVDRPDWYSVGGGEAGWIAPSPDGSVVYAGEYQGQITRWDRLTRQTKHVSVLMDVTDGMGAAPLDHRFQWTAPIVMSPHDSNVVYHAAERLFKTTDGGMTWEAISPDLTRNDKSKQKLWGGPVVYEDTGTDYYNTIFAVAESRVQKDLIWVGTDDGLLHLTRDGGKTWANVTPKDLPESRISLIDASPHDAGTAYVAVDRHESDDYRPHIYKTSDFGKSWTKITRGIPDGDFVRAVREDPVRKGLLYAGTETGVYVSYNDGAGWHSLKLNLPTTPVRDLVVKGNDLVLATHGRSFWILDDVSPLRQQSAELAKKDFHLYTPAVALRMHDGGGWRRPTLAGENPPAGAILYYSLKSQPKELVIEVYDSKGERVRRISSDEYEPQRAPLDPEDEKPKKLIEPKAGLNRFVWDLRYDGVPRIPGYFVYYYTAGLEGPKVVPGKYEVRLTVDGKTQSAPLEVKLDPRINVPQEDLEKQLAFLLDVRKELIRLYDAARQIQDLRAQLKGLDERLPKEASLKDVMTAGADLDGKAAVIEGELRQLKIEANQDSLMYPVGLDARISFLAGMVGDDTDSAPPQSAYSRFEKLRARLDQQLVAWSRMVNTDLPGFQNLAQQHRIGAIVLPQLLKTEGQQPAQ